MIPQARLITGWRGSDQEILPALRQVFTYDSKWPDRATGFVYDAGTHGWPPGQPCGWPEPLREIGPRLLEDLEWDTGVAATVVAFQAYRNGTGCGWHTDREWDAQAILSLGVTRTLGLRHPGHEENLSLAHGDLLVMPPGFQDHWEHCVPPEDVPGERCSVVFRSAHRR